MILADTEALEKETEMAQTTGSYLLSYTINILGQLAISTSFVKNFV